MLPTRTALGTTLIHSIRTALIKALTWTKPTLTNTSTEVTLHSSDAASIIPSPRKLDRHVSVATLLTDAPVIWVCPAANQNIRERILWVHEYYGVPRFTASIQEFSTIVVVRSNMAAQS